MPSVSPIDGVVALAAFVVGVVDRPPDLRRKAMPTVSTDATHSPGMRHRTTASHDILTGVARAGVTHPDADHRAAP